MPHRDELFEALASMQRLIPGRGNRFGALGYGIGRRLVEGRVTTERAILVFVPRKSHVPAVPLPSMVPGTAVPIDVVALGHGVDGGAPPELPEDSVELGPASPLGLASSAWQFAAGVGLPFEEPEYLLTVRHPFAQAQRGASVFSFARRIGRVSTATEFEGHDLALVRLAQRSELRRSVSDGVVLSRSSAMQLRQLGAALSFYSPVRGSLIRPRVIAMGVTAFLLPWGDGGLAPQRDLIMTEIATSPGDSGAPLFDDQGTVFGLASFRTDQFSFFESLARRKVETLLGEVS